MLDVATGTGNAALRAAARGAEMIGVYFEPTRLKIAGQRLTMRHWRRCGGSVIRCAASTSGWADLIVSVFGVIHALDHAHAARELTRAARHGGRIVLAAWTRGACCRRRALCSLRVYGSHGEDSLPMWLADPEWEGFCARSGSRTAEAGLRCRPVHGTLADTLAWERELGLYRRRKAGIGAEREAELIAALADG